MKLLLAGDQEQAGVVLLQHSRVWRVEEANGKLQDVAHKVLQRFAPHFLKIHPVCISQFVATRKKKISHRFSWIFFFNSFLRFGYKYKQRGERILCRNGEASNYVQIRRSGGRCSHHSGECQSRPAGLLAVCSHVKSWSLNDLRYRYPVGCCTGSNKHHKSWIFLTTWEVDWTKLSCATFEGPVCKIWFD